MSRALHALVVIILLSAIFVAGTRTTAQTSFRVRTVVDRLTIPWEIIWNDDGWIWMTERYGRISRVHPETGELQPLLRVEEVAHVGESGMLGMAITANALYVVYNYRNGSQLLRS